MGNYVKLIRPINVLIVFLTQLILYKLVIFNKISSPSLDLFLATLLAICTCLITACGYIINDYYDQDIDRINKPNAVIIGSKISESNALLYYSFLNLLGLLISCYIASATDNFHLIPIYPIAHFLLFMYAKKWKLLGFIGNNVVAVMTSFVAWIILIAERKDIFLPENKNSLSLIFAFGVFSYLINLVRELVKDIQDVEGDKLKNSTSMAIVSGEEKTKVMILFNTCALTFLIVAFIFYFPHTSLTTAYSILLILLPIIYFIYKIKDATNTKAFSAMSLYLKGIMISGLLYLCLLSFNS